MSRKAIIIYILLVSIGYIIGRTPTTQEKQDRNDQEGMMQKLDKERNLYNNLYMQCEQKYALLQQGNTSGAADVQKQIDSQLDPKKSDWE